MRPFISDIKAGRLLIERPIMVERGKRWGAAYLEGPRPNVLLTRFNDSLLGARFEEG